MDMISIYKNLVSNLERQELESSIHGSASPQIYGQLLAIYLLMNDLYVFLFIYFFFVVICFFNFLVQMQNYCGNEYLIELKKKIMKLKLFGVSE